MRTAPRSHQDRNFGHGHLITQPPIREFMHLHRTRVATVATSLLSLYAEHKIFHPWPTSSRSRWGYARTCCCRQLNDRMALSFGCLVITGRSDNAVESFNSNYFWSLRRWRPDTETIVAAYIDRRVLTSTGIRQRKTHHAKTKFY